MKYDVVVIGAGAAGLMATKDLLNEGLSVCLLEAAAVAGGRIATLHEHGFDQPIETGAEFVHGKLPLTLKLLNKAGIQYLPVEGEMVSVRKEKWQENEDHDQHWNAFIRQLSHLKDDMTIDAFLEKYFSAGKYAGLRAAVKSFAGGFDLADTNKASSLAAYVEWAHEGETQYRIPGGYVQLIDFLLKECDQPNAVICYNACAKKIEYNSEGVLIYTADDKKFAGAKLIITASAGILQSGGLEFVPALNAHAHAICQLGFGTVIKILLQFKTPFWKMHSANIGFLLSDEGIPTWWTQLPVDNNLLTGWLGGPAALAKANEPDDALLNTALQSLAAIFHLPVEEISSQLTHHHIISWHDHPHIMGGYSYVTVDAPNAKKILSHPVEGVIFFAGEAIYSGQSQGTVEAALQSGREVAEQIKQLKQKPL